MENENLMVEIVAMLDFSKYSASAQLACLALRLDAGRPRLSAFPTAR